MKNLFFYSLTFKSVLGDVSVGASCHLQPITLTFATEKQLDRYQKSHESECVNAEWGMHEIDLKTCKDLIKLSKKKVKEKCPECGK